MSTSGGSAGPGGGGAGTGDGASTGGAGGTSTGGGGGAGGYTNSGNQFGGRGAGGPGLVVVRGPNAFTYSVAPGTNTQAPDGGDTVCSFTVSGTLTVEE